MKLSFEFSAVFTVTLVTVALVTYLWSLITRGESAVDWGTAFTFAILFGILLS